MLSNVAVCPLASFILILVIIINILDIYLVGFQFAIIVTNILISIFFVWVANKTCDKYHWVSWLITVYFVICIIGGFALILTPSAAGTNQREGFVEGATGSKKDKKDKKDKKETNTEQEEEEEE